MPAVCLAGVLTLDLQRGQSACGSILHQGSGVERELNARQASPLPTQGCHGFSSSQEGFLLEYICACIFMNVIKASTFQQFGLHWFLFDLYLSNFVSPETL